MPFVHAALFLKARDSDNDQLNENGYNAKLKACYNHKKVDWSRRLLSTMFSLDHTYTVFVQAWSDFLLIEVAS